MIKESHLIKSTIMLGVAVALSKITGFVREIVLAAFFGADTGMCRRYREGG